MNQPLRTGPILVVDDNSINATLISHLISRHGRAVELASSGRDALRRIASGGIRGTLMDLRMPDMDGFDTARAIRASERSGRMPIIAVSADARQGLREKAVAAGMDDLLLKPVSVATIASMISRHFPGDEPTTTTETAEDIHEVPSPLDASSLRRALRANPAAAGRLLGDCIAGLSEVRDSVPALLAGGSFLEAQRLAHRVRTHLAEAGALELDEVLQELADALRSGDRLRSGRALRLVEAARSRFCSALATQDAVWSSRADGSVSPDGTGTPQPT